MSSFHVLVIGASGDVGRGVVGAAVDRGWSVTAAARSVVGLAELRSQWPELPTVIGDVATAEGATALADAAGIDWSGVVVAVNTAAAAGPLLEMDYAAVAQHLAGNLAPHLHCMQAFLPKLDAGAVFLGIGGGMADFVVPGMAAISMAQAAQRMAYRHAAKEVRTRQVAVRELLIRSMVAGASNRGKAAPAWLTDRQIGERVCEILADPGDVRDPVLSIDP